MDFSGAGAEDESRRTRAARREPGRDGIAETAVVSPFEVVVSRATRSCTREAYRSRFHACTEHWRGQCRGQVGIKRAYRAGARFVWVPFASWWKGNVGPNHGLGPFERQRVAQYPNPCVQYVWVEHGAIVVPAHCYRWDEWLLRPYGGEF